MTKLIDSRWEIENEINSKQGGNGIVFPVLDTEENIQGLLALKRLKESKEKRYVRFRQEVTAMEELHKSKPKYFIPILFKYLPKQFLKDSLPYFIMPWYSKGSLANLMGKFETPEELISRLLPMVKSIQYLHSIGLFHRDIKPQNVLIQDNDTLVISDYGLVFNEEQEFHFSSEDEIVGSKGYRGPEYLDGRYEETNQRPGDIYSLGMTIWAVAFGEHPKELINLRQSKYNLVAQKNRDWAQIQSLVQDMTNHRNELRPTIEEVIEVLNEILNPSKSSSKLANNLEQIKAITTFAKTNPKISMSISKEEQYRKLNQDVYSFFNSVGDSFKKRQEFRALEKLNNIEGFEFNFTSNRPTVSGLLFEIKSSSIDFHISLHVQIITDRSPVQSLKVSLKSFFNIRDVSASIEMKGLDFDLKTRKLFRKLANEKFEEFINIAASKINGINSATDAIHDVFETRAKEMSLKSQIKFEDFNKIDIRTGTILAAKKIPKTRDLIVCQVDLGFEERQIVLNTNRQYSAEDIIHRKVLVLVNISKRTIKGYESNGIILMSHDERGNLNFVRSKSKNMENGMQIS